MPADEILQEPLDELEALNRSPYLPLPFYQKNKAIISGYRELLELHKPAKQIWDYLHCEGCSAVGHVDVSFPCPTRQIIDKALGVSDV